VIKSLLGGRKYHLQVTELATSAVHTRKPRSTAGAKAAKPVVKLPTAELAVWEIAGAHCSANERRADEASRDVEAWLKCKFMREHLGEEYGGTVSAVTTFGLFVQLDELYVEGLVHITELGGEYYRFDEARQELRGERTGVRYAIGSRVRVQVSRVDLDGRKIDFRLVREAAPPGSRPVREKATAAVEELKSVQEADRGQKRAAKSATRNAAGKTGSRKSPAAAIEAAERNRAVRAERKGKRARR
jgi:ribonuclease R